MEAPSMRPLSLVSDGLGEEDWILEDRYGKCVPLLKTAMLFLGREECDILLKSKSVDGQHAVLVYDEFVERFKVKDLTSINGTFVNESRIPEDTYVYVDHADTLRFGYDSMVYRVLSNTRLANDVPAKKSTPETAVTANNNNVSNISVKQRSIAASDDLPSWAAKEMETMESPTSCLEDQLLLPGVLPPVMAECMACMAENRMECRDCEELTPRPPSDNHSCGYCPPSPVVLRRSNGFPPRARQDPPSTLPLSSKFKSWSGTGKEQTPTTETTALIEQMQIQSPPGATTPNHRATSAMILSPGSRRKSVRELYGQPSWWGEDDGDMYSYPHTASLAGQEKPALADPGKPPRGKTTPRASQDPSSRPNTADSTQPQAPPSRPAEAFTVVFEPETVPDEEEDRTSASETPPPAGQPLSQFVPSKIRRSFQERQQERQQVSKRRQQRPMSDKPKSETSTSSNPGRSATSAPRTSTRPSNTPSTNRQPKSSSRPATAVGRLDMGAATGKKPPISKQRPASAVTRSSVDPSVKRTAGQSTGQSSPSGSPRNVTTPKSAINPRKNITLRKSGSADKLKTNNSVSIDALKSHGEQRKGTSDKIKSSGGVNIDALKSYGEQRRGSTDKVKNSSVNIDALDSYGEPKSESTDKVKSRSSVNIEALDSYGGPKGGMTDKVTNRSSVNIDSLKSYEDTKSYLFDKMFDGNSKTVTSPPLVPHNTNAMSPTPRQEGDEASEAGTYTIEREDKEYDAARRADLSGELEMRGMADGKEMTERQSPVEEEDEEEMDEPLSVCEMTDISGMEDVEQEEIELKTSNTPKWLTELQPNSPSVPQSTHHSRHSKSSKESAASVTNGETATLSPSSSMPHAASSASLNSMPPMAMDGSGEYHRHLSSRGHHSASFHQQHHATSQHPRSSSNSRHHTNSSGSSSGSNSSSVRQHKSTHHLGDTSPTGGLPVHRTGSTVSLQLPPYSGGKYRGGSTNRSSTRDSDYGAYNAMALAYHNHQLQQQQQHVAVASHSRKASESLIADVLSTSRSGLDPDMDMMSSSSLSMFTGAPQPLVYQHQHSAPYPHHAATYSHPRHFHRLSYHESYSLLDSRLPHDTAGLLQDTEEVLNDMQHRVMLANHGRNRTAGSMDCIPYADEYTDDDTPAPAQSFSASGKRHSMATHHYQRSSLEGMRRGSLPPSPGDPPTPTGSAFRAPRSVTSTTGDSGGSTKRSLGARIVEKSRENLQTSAASSSASSSSTTVAQQQVSNNVSPGAEGHGVNSRAEFGRHSLKLPTSNCPGFTTIGAKMSQSPRVSSWQRRKEYDARKVAARQSSTGSLGSSAGGQESGGSAGGSLDDPSVGKVTTDLSKDLEVLARREDLTLGGGRRSAFSPLHSSPDSPGASAAHGRTAQLPHGGFRSRSAAVLNETGAGGQTYDGLMVSSILHLSTKLRRCSNEILHKMKKCHHLSRTPSPADDCFNNSNYNNVNQDLSESLNNLKAVEYQMQVMERALFPQAKSGRSSALGSCTEGEYLMELERINHELKGFTPIDAPSPSLTSDVSQPSTSAPFTVAPQPVAPIPVTSGASVTSGTNGSYASSSKKELYY